MSDRDSDVERDSEGGINKVERIFEIWGEREGHTHMHRDRERGRLLEREGERRTHIHIEIERDENTRAGRANE